MSTDTVLNKQQCLDVLNELKGTLDTIAKKYGTDVETIRRIVKNAKQVNTSEDKYLHGRKRKKLKSDECVSRELLKWCEKRRKQGHQVSDISMLEKAFEIKTCFIFAGYQDFELNFIWIKKFVKQNIEHLDQIEANALCNNWRHCIDSEKVHLENIYNMSETQLSWQAIPKNILDASKTKGVCHCKSRENKITVALCTNATGNNKVAPFIIHNDETQKEKFIKCTERLPALPCRYSMDANMDQKLFIDWFENHFKPSVRKYQEKMKIPGKVILFIDDRMTHKTLSEHKNSEDYKIIYISTRTAPLIQPMDRGIIKTIKIYYQDYLRQQLYIIQAFYQNHCLKERADSLNKSWEKINADIIRYAWLHIFPNLGTFYIVNKPHAEVDTSSFRRRLNRLMELNLKCETNDSIINS